MVFYGSKAKLVLKFETIKVKARSTVFFGDSIENVFIVTVGAELISF